MTRGDFAASSPKSLVSILLSPFSIQHVLPIKTATKYAILCKEKCTKAVEDDKEKLL
jgi:hypothetical protein